MAMVSDKDEVRVRPTGAALAADIEGVDLAGPLAPETLAALKQAWADHLVLRFRGQNLSDDDLMRFSRQFGELDWAPVAATNDAPEGREYIMVVSNVVENGQAVGQLGA
jgi:taurine dioxygenase